MRSNKPWLELGLVLLSFCAGACSSSSTALAPSCTATASSNVVTNLPAAAANVITVTVNGSQCSNYPNEPCASVQICTPGGSCSAINNLLVDTGSYGLRVFSSVLTAAGVTGTMIPSSGGGNLGECVGFGDNSSEFGPVELFDVQLGGESKISSLPILVINDTGISGFGSPPSACNSTNSSPDTSPSEAGFNGILGVGLFDYDCGQACASQVNNGSYFSCTGPGCSGAAAPLASQVQNPVFAQSADNNGVVLMFPSVPDGGLPSLTGALVMGIGTRPNNMPTNVKLYAADSEGNFTTVFNPFSSESMGGFIDSGSNILFFPWPPPSATDDATLPSCEGSAYFCPGSEQNFAAANTGFGGTPSSCVPFNVSNAHSQLSGGNKVFSNLAGLAGSDLSSDFDWGLPFFFGRAVYVGIIGKTATGLGKGPYWAY